MSEKTQRFNVRKLTMTAMLGAVASVLMFISVNVPLMPSFIKLDLSELPALIASFARDVSFLSWLAYGETVGIPTASPMYLDLSVVKVAFGLEMGINVAQIFTIALSIFCYKATVHKL